MQEVSKLFNKTTVNCEAAESASRYEPAANTSILLPWLIAAALTVATASAADRPNVLWITSEDNSPYLGCYGDALAKTPNLDRLANEGARYRYAFANAPVCSSARTTLITGMPKPQLAARLNDEALDVRVAAAEALAHLGKGANAMEALAVVVRNGNLHETLATQNALDFLREAGLVSTTQVRAIVAFPRECFRTWRANGRSTTTPRATPTRWSESSTWPTSRATVGRSTCRR